MVLLANKQKDMEDVLLEGLFPLQLACFAPSLFAMPPSSSAKQKPNSSNLNWVTLVPKWKLWGEDEGVVMGQGLPVLTRSVDAWEGQQLLLSPSPCTWHSSGHLSLSPQVCLLKLKLSLISFIVLGE